ncbi:MAG: transcription repressor NadR [Lachnospiraceae bacterium]|nr:transcription repressor NadR [Lachnospiraceae bacterium]
MDVKERREKIVSLLQNAKEPISGSALAKMLNISRQVVVQDVALLKAQNCDIISTYRGYILENKAVCKRIFKVKHTDEQTVEELNLFVDFGGVVEDVFVYHKVYDVIRAELGLKSRKDVLDYIQKFKDGKSKSLKEVTSDYHYHTITADNENILNQIQDELEKRGFLAELREYEPIELQR